ncbi:hypothetical protein ACN28C_26380 [Plantactinospora sp. WMMC1484]|uniref:hypothetical protein n=1 Tax=Plantactinospora sp. WMMC1484 TaxID=3404122 RepID=UPI003BF57511
MASVCLAELGCRIAKLGTLDQAYETAPGDDPLQRVRAVDRAGGDGGPAAHRRRAHDLAVQVGLAQ